MNNFEKQASNLNTLLSGNDTKEFQVKFAELGGEYLNTKVREESIAEKILTVLKVDENHPQVQRDLDSDTLYFYEEIEQDSTAMEVAMRADAKPRIVDSKVYTIRPGKLETESVKKGKMEMRVAKNVVKFIKENNVDALARTQDTVFLRTVRAALKATGSILNGTVVTPNNFAFGTYTNAIDWTGGAKVEDLVSLMNVIKRKELKPARWMMSDSAYGIFSAMPADEIGDLAGTNLTEGFSGNLLKLPVVTTIKSTLADNLTGENFFDHVADDGKVYSDIYLFVEPNFLGKIIKIDDDAIWSEWKKDVFEWMSWRYVGLGFGDIRGIAMLRVQIA